MISIQTSWYVSFYHLTTQAHSSSRLTFISKLTSPTYPNISLGSGQKLLMPCTFHLQLRQPPNQCDSFFISLWCGTLYSFKTIQDNKVAWLDMEGFLSHLNHLPKLAIVTMHGTQHLLGVSWLRPLLPPCMFPKQKEIYGFLINNGSGASSSFFLQPISY